MIDNTPLTLEEAVAMAPPRPPLPIFIASTAAIAWGAVRAGMSIWEYIIGMTQEFEAKLQADYEAWKAEKAWYRTPSAPANITLSHTDEMPEGNERVTVAAEETLAAVLAGLPKKPMEEDFAAILATTDSDTLRFALQAFIEKRKRAHGPRSAQLAFLKWLEENNTLTYKEANT